MVHFLLGTSDSQPLGLEYFPFSIVGANIDSFSLTGSGDFLPYVPTPITQFLARRSVVISNFISLFGVLYDWYPYFLFFWFRSPNLCDFLSNSAKHAPMQIKNPNFG
jgi:hypothetical protein